MSLDPAMRGWMNDVKSYLPPIGINEVMRAIGVARIAASKNPTLAVGIQRAGLAKIRRHARITIICGAISQYNNTTPVQGPKNYLSLLVNRGMMTGMVVFDCAERFPMAIAEMAEYLKDGRMKSKEDLVKGLDTFPETLLKLFSGGNFGKLLLQVAD